MRGHVRKRGSLFAFVVELGRDPSTGRRLQQWTSGFTSKKEADEALALALTKLATGNYVRPHKMTVAELLEQWLAVYVEPSVRPNTLIDYRTVVRGHLIPAMGSTPLMDLKPAHLQSYYAKALKTGRRDGRGGLSPTSVRHHHRLLSEALSYAVRQDLISRNVAQAATPPRPRRFEPKTWTGDDLKRFLASIEGSEYHALFHLLLFSGMRRSEALALSWTDIDLPGSVLRIRRSLHVLPGREVIFLDTKTAMSRRRVDLPPAATMALRAHKERQRVDREALGILEPTQDVEANWPTSGPDALVFSHLDGHPLLPQTVSHIWPKLVKKAGVPRVRLHDARHSHASLMLEAGIHPKIVQERLGHSSVSITLDLYSHVAPGLQEAAARRFEEGLELEPDPPDPPDVAEVRESSRQYAE